MKAPLVPVFSGQFSEFSFDSRKARKEAQSFF